MPTVIPGVYIRPPVIGTNGQNVIGPHPSNLHSVARWLDTNGQQLGDSGLIIDEGNNLIVPGTVNGRVVQQDGANLDQLLTLVPRIPTQSQKDALAGTNGTPSSTNKYVTDSDPRLTGGGGGGINPPAGQIGGTTGSPTVLGIRETSGPTLLTFSAIPDHGFLRRSGTSVVGQLVPFTNEGVLSTAVSATLAFGQTVVAVTDTSATRTLTLPAVSGVDAGYHVTIHDTSGAAGVPNDIIIAPAGGDTINGFAAPIHINVPYKFVTVVMQNGSWWLSFSSTPGEVTKVSRVIDVVVDCGADPTGVADSLAAFNKAQTLASAGNREIYIPSGTYFLSDTWVITFPIKVRGAGSRLGTYINIKGGHTGIKVVATGSNGIAATFQDFSLSGSFGVPLWQANQTNYDANSAVIPTAGLNVNIRKSSGFVMLATSGTHSGPSEPTWPTTEGGTVTETGVSDPVTWTAHSIQGILLKESATLTRLAVSTIAGDGIAVISDSGDGDQANDFTMYECETSSCAARGFYFYGADANQGSLFNCEAVGNTNEGFRDESQIGNKYWGCNGTANGPGGVGKGFRTPRFNASPGSDYTLSNQTAGQHADFFGCYLEGGQTADIQNFSSWWGEGGNSVRGFGRISGQSRSNYINIINDTNDDGTGLGVFLNIGQTGTQALFSFGFTQDSSVASTLTYGTVSGGIRTGWVGLNHAGDGKSAFAFSIGNEPHGAGHMWFPNKVFRGPDDAGGNRYQEDTSNSGPPTGTYSRNGDRSMERVPWVTGALGYLCVVDVAGSGDASTWANIRANRVRSMAADTQAEATEWYMGVTDLTVSRTFTLLSAFDGLAHADGTEIVVKDETGLCSPAKTITVTATHGETINGVTSLVLDSSGASLTLVRRGVTWYIKSQIKATVTVTDSTASRSLAAADIGTLLTNDGAGASVTFTLPAAASGLYYHFGCVETFGLVIQAVGSDLIYLGTATSSAGGTLTTTDVGATLTLRATRNGRWMVFGPAGSWAPA